MLRRPADGYVHTERMHSLGLTDYAFQGYLEIALNAFQKYVERTSKSENRIEVLAKLLEFMEDTMGASKGFR